MFPVALCAELLFVGLALLLFTRKKNLGKIFIGAGTLLFIFMSQPYVGDKLLSQLEFQHPVLQEPLDRGKDQIFAKWIVVLGGGYMDNPKVSLTSRHSGTNLFRLIEGIRIHRQIPASKLILSGGKNFGTEGRGEGEGMRELALALGVADRDLVIEGKSRNTFDQAMLIKPIVGSDRFVLVTSASHMVRAVKIFKKQGMDPIPAPTDYLSSIASSSNYLRFIPSTDGFRKSSRSVYEFLGLIWGKFRGQLD